MSLAETHVRSTPTVLLVEDDPALRRILLLVLRGAGFETNDVATGGEALAVLEERPPNAVVLDLGLPDGLGRAVCERLRRWGQDGSRFPAWVVMSALDFGEAKRRYGQLDCPFLAKPFNPMYLVRLVGELLSVGGQPEQLQGGGNGNDHPAAS